MGRPKSDRANFKPSSPGFDPDEANARDHSHESEQDSDEPEAEPEPEAEREHHAPFNPHPGPLLHRPVFGRKGL